MRYSKTALMELSHKYRSILRKCAFLNATILMGVMIASPAIAGYQGGITISENTRYENQTVSNLDFRSESVTSRDSNKGFGGLAFVDRPATLDVQNSKYSELTFDGSGTVFATRIPSGENKASLNITSTTFENNHAREDGGAIGNYNQLTITDATFKGNTALLSKDENGEYTISVESNTPIGGGAIALGAISATNVKATAISNTLFEKNVSGLNGGAIGTRLAENKDDKKSKNDNSGAKLDIEGTFVENSAKLSGGAIYNTFYADNGLGKGEGVTVSAVFKDNSAGQHGGAIYNDGTADTTGNNGGVMTITASEFTGNTAETGWGGAIYSGSRGRITVKDSEFKNNIAFNAGALAAGKQTTGTTIINSTFENNSAEAYGAVALFKTGELENVIFKGNKATGTQTLGEDGTAVNHGAGALFLGAESVVKITDGRFEENTSGTRGGAIATRMPEVANNKAAKLDIDGAVFDGNTAAAEGGAIYSSFYNSVEVIDNVSIKNATFSNNKAQNGGAIYNEGFADVGGNKASMHIEDSEFTNNDATSLGGALYNEEGATINLAQTNVFSGNTANGVANDIHNDGTLNISGDLTLDGGISGNGSVTFAQGTSLTAELQKTTILANSVTFEGDNSLNLIVANGLANADYDFITATKWEGEEDVGIADNAVYNLKLTEDGKINVSVKSGSEIIDGIDAPVTEAEGETLSAVIASNGNGTAVGNEIADAISEALQTGNAIEAVKAAKELAPTTSQQVMGVAQSVNSLLSNVTSNRMATVGRSGGDTFVGGSAWAQALYNHTKQDASGSATGFSADTKGVALGIDGKLNESLTVGLGYGYNQTDADSDGRDIDVDGHNFFAYAKYQPNAWYINGMFSYGLNKYTEKKAPMGVAMEAKYDVNTYAANVMSGYDFENGITPEAGLRYVLADQESYNDGAQRISTDNNDVLTAVVGVKYSKDVTAKDWTFEPSVRLAATYDILSDNSEANVNVIGGANYQITGQRLHRFGVEAGAGITGTIKNWDLSLEYNAGLREDFQTHTGMLKAKYNF